MATATLVTHCGARVVTRDELEEIKAPPPTSTWFPTSHIQVLDKATETLGNAGFTVRKTNLALSRGDARFFGTLDLECPLVPGVNLAVGLRNSIDKSLPIGFCAGNRVFVCDNLCFRSDLLVNRKHTRFGETRFGEAIALAVQSLQSFKDTETERITRFQATDLTSDRAESLMLRAYEKELVSHRLLPRVISEWRNPSFEEFEPRTLWSLLNAFTTVLGERHRSNPQQFASLTINLQALLEAPAPEVSLHQAS